MAADAAAGRVLSMFADGEELPEPGEVKKTKPDDPGGFVSMVFIGMRGCNTPPFRLNLTRNFAGQV
jgi:hypothetical protein